jgi:hypothetical protein
MKHKPPLVVDNQQLAAQLVRSWRDNFIKESGGPDGLPPLLIVGGKALMAADILTNIAAAIDLIPRPSVVNT